MRRSLVVLALAVLLPLVVAAATDSQPQYKLGGTFIGHSSTGNLWNSLQVPLDPAGRTAALRVSLTTYGPDLAWLLTAFGADTVGESVGEQAMISRDTAKYRTVGYATAHGNPPQVRLIVVMTGMLQFADADNITVTYTLDGYLPTADADGDGYPDPGAVPAVSVPGTDSARRVPIR